MVSPLNQYRPQSRVLARSVLDRLLDASPDIKQDPPISLLDQLREMREAIRRDLEALLNTRRCPITPPSELTELKNALACYGVDGIVSVNLVTDEAKLVLARALERTITRFETRLSDVRVTILRNGAGSRRTLRIRIEAMFRPHDGMPPISFETMIDPSTQHFLVEAPRG
ncbi:type VI secretion system baseplate subunit TssE [Phyllobacterium phragmitis]|uniref:Type VI secretion system baseplate subunit TssE n=1 Tax=Phyllobacterium phragmitis TaxID=2670329 RepID=A0A2S9IKV2_9HYPH|nr:type VI secretion system baseplate subunit TssE [Phyllobacterium phragmitis]PRD41150.1 type VI secretion system baseplate subunit TssE [Phyllobacterium phragmitis]